MEDEDEEASSCDLFHLRSRHHTVTDGWKIHPVCLSACLSVRCKLVLSCGPSDVAGLAWVWQVCFWVGNAVALVVICIS